LFFRRAPQSHIGEMGYGELRPDPGPEPTADPMPTPAAAAPPQAAPAPVLVCVDPARTHEVWPHVAPLIARAMRRGGLSAAADVARDLAAGTALLWLAWDGERILAAAVTALELVEGEKLCTIVACGGEGFARFGPLIGGLERYARAEGCARMRICGRKGWVRLLPDYRVRRVIIEKQL
jgi:hypothetical protein